MKKLGTKQSKGVIPKSFKWMTQDRAIENLPWPASVTIPIRQHQGPLPKVLVKTGQQVTIGEVIAQADHPRSVNVHASISGTISSIVPGLDQDDANDVLITIENTGTSAFKPKQTTIDDVMTDDAQSLIKRIQAAGVVGLGGAVFPTHLKLSIPPEKKIDTLIINGAECEPYINADYRLMIEQADRLVKGIQLVNKIISAQTIVLAVERHHADAITAVEKAAQQHLALQSIVLPVSYPQGDESILIKTIMGKEVPVGGLPWDTGAVVLNISTLVAIQQALLENQPLIDRVVTVSGAAVKQQKNLRVPIGTPLQTVVDFCGGLLPDTKKVLTGGPMMGTSQPDLNKPVVKAANGVIALLDQDLTQNQLDQPCIRCGRCVEACPYGLQPELLFKAVRRGKLHYAQDNFLFSCRVCGCCDYVCPARIPLAEIFRQGKAKIKSSQH